MVVMMADESDDCRDVVRYWEVLNEGWDAVFGSRFVRGGGVVDYPAAQADSESFGEPVSADYFSRPAERFHQCLQGVPPKGDRGLPAISFAAFQSDHRDPAQDHCARLLLDRDTDHLAQPAVGCVQAQDRERWAAGICSSPYIAGWRSTSLAETTYRKAQPRP